MMKQENEYLQQVISSQAQVESSLNPRKRKMIAPPPLGAPMRRNIASSTPVQNYRITGLLWFKNVIVPPNMYVVHTRRGHKDPVTVGLGVSFRYNPWRDSFLVVPSAMQTIVVNANSICKERQGIVVQSYLQWIIDDFSVAYRKLDFSDPDDPMSVVNVQLREQAEAVIKDTVSTMNIDDILSDKTPIIEELTTRLRELADGLGLKIVTVQIKEAIVSSTTLWDNLQKPFRAERARDARLAELEHQDAVNKREQEAEKTATLLRIQKEEEISERKSKADAASFNQEYNEKIRRARLEADMLEEKTDIDKKKLAVEHEIMMIKLKDWIEEEKLRKAEKHKFQEQDLILFGKRQEIENSISQNRLQERLIERLPEIIEQLPNPDELKTISLGSTQLDGVLGSINNMMGNFSKKQSD